MKAFRLTAIAVSISAALFALSAFTPPRQSDVIQIRADALANSSAPRLLVMGCANLAPPQSVGRRELRTRSRLRTIRIDVPAPVVQGVSASRFDSSCSRRSGPRR